MEFQLVTSGDRSVSNMTSNITGCLKAPTSLDDLLTINPKSMAETFGEREPDFHPGDYEYYRKGYTDPEWYFTGPSGTVLGIGFRFGVPRLRGKNLDNKFLSPEEICELFVQQVVYSIELDQEDRSVGEQ